jgi:hypothetical protein
MSKSKRRSEFHRSRTTDNDLGSHQNERNVSRDYQPATTSVVSAHTGTNADLIRQVCMLYLRNGYKVADVTFGLGAFWAKPTPHFVIGSDIDPNSRASICADMRRLPYAANFFNVVVIDPPYIHSPGFTRKKHMADRRYSNAKYTKGFYHDDIMKLYTDAMREAIRVIIPGGQVWVKCKDQVMSGIQRWSHIDLFNIAVALELYARDLFVIIPSARLPHARWTTQHHARKIHSYLWIFQKSRSHA